MSKLVRRLLIGLLLFLLSLGGATTLLLGNASGLNWLLQQPSLLALLPGELRIERVEGGLFGELHLFGLSYRDSTERLEIGELYLRWRPEALWQGILHITSLELSRVRYEMLQADTTPAPKPQDLVPPLEFLLEQARVQDVSLITAPGAAPVSLQQLLLKARWNTSGITLEQLSLKRQEMLLEMDGQLTPVGAYPLEMNMALEFEPGELPRMAVHGRLSGDLQQLVVELEMGGAYGARLKSRIEQPFDRLGWQAELVVDKLPARLMGEELPSDLVWQIAAKGDLERADGTIGVHAVDAGALSDATTGASVQLTTSLLFDSLEFEAKGGWQNLQWPLTGPSRILSGNGRLVASGDPENYEFELQGELTGAEIPAGNWSIFGYGGAQQVMLTRIEGETLGGRLKADASVAWAPALAWQLNLDAVGLDPSRSWSEWPGQLDLQLSASGREREGRPWIRLALGKLEGRLRGYPVHGKGGFVMEGSRMRVEQAELHSGSAWLQANGMLAPHRDLEWAFDFPKLAELVPGGRGRLQGKGRLAGSGQMPEIVGILEGEAVAYHTLSFQRLKMDLALAPEPQMESRIVVEAQGLEAAGQQIDAASLVLTGPLEKHRIRIDIEHARGHLELAAQGAFQQTRNRWQGNIQQLDLEGRDFGAWRLERPAALGIAAEALKLAPLCLQQGDAAVCSEVVWAPSSGHASTTLRGLSLEQLRPLLPKEITQLEGMVEADLDVDLAPRPTARLSVVLRPGELSYQVDSGHLIHLQYRGGRVDAELGRERLTARWELAVGDSGASGELDIPRQPLEQTPIRAPLQGAVRFQIKQLGLLSALVPELQETQGTIDGRLTLGGVVGAPVVKGSIDLEMEKAQLPLTGITLQDIELHLTGNGSERLQISGGLSSGPGRLQIDGYLSLERQQGWPASLSIRGERFQAVDLANIQLLVSPDIRVEHGSKGVEVTGTLRLPEARLILDSIPGSARKLSPDVVIITADEAGATGGSGLPIHARVTVELGKKVHFRGFGLNADLGGRLTVSSKPGRLLVGNGELVIIQGSFRALGQELNIERGRLFYAGGPLSNPGFDIKASRYIDDMTVGVRVTGSAKKSKFIGYSSDPNMTEEDALSLLLTGHLKGEGSASTTRAYFGANLTDRFSVGTRTSMETDQKEFVGRYRLSRRWSIESISSAEKSGAEVVYTIELE